MQKTDIYFIQKICKKRIFKISVSLFSIITLISGVWYNTRDVQGVDFAFTQTNWSGGQTANTATHTSNQSGWTQYNNKNSGITTSGTDVTLTDVSTALTKSSDADFNAGTFSSSAVSGTGSAAVVQLQQQVITDGGTGANGAYTCTTGTCTLVANTYNYTTFNISSGATVKVTGANALIIKATGDVTIAGTLDLAGGLGCPGPGGGGGGGNGGIANMSGQASVTGGGAGGIKQKGGKSAGGGGGGGGGTVYINSNSNVVVASTGIIDATGGSANGGQWGKMGGHGAGGKIVLASPSITNNGLIDVSVKAYVSGADYGEVGIITLKYDTFSGTVPSGSTTPGLSTGYPSSGTYTSDAIDVGQKSVFTTLGYNTTLNGQTITIDVRGGNTSTPDGTWTAWQSGIANGGDISALNSVRYVQYRVNLSTANTTLTPTLNDITFNYHFRSPAQDLISSIYNAEKAVATISKLQWTENLPANTDIKFQIRTSINGGSWSSWCGPDDGVANSCNSTTFFTDPTGNEINERIDDTQQDKSGDQYIQYKATLMSSDGVNTPILSGVTLSYVTTITPSVVTQSATNITHVSAIINANITNAGGENPIREIDYGTTSGNYTSSCSKGTGAEGTYYCNLTGLQPNTTYFFKAKATNSVATAYGEELQFTTGPIPNEVTIANPDTTKMQDAATNQYFAINQGLPTSAQEVETNTTVKLTTTNTTITLPPNTTITEENNNAFNFTNFVTENKTADVRNQNGTSHAAVKIGVPNTIMQFSQPITLTLTVGQAYNGRTMDILYQEDNEIIWHTQGTCTIANGQCAFQTDHATTYTVNGDGTISGAGQNDITTDVQDVLSLDCDQTGNTNDDIIEFGNLTPGTPVTGSTTCTVTTNSDQGYTLAVKRNDTNSTMDKDGDTATDITDRTLWNNSTPSATTWQTNDTGLAFTIYNTTATKNTTWWGTGTTVTDANNKYAGFPSTYTDIMQHTEYDETATTVDIGYKLDVPTTQKSGIYSGDITYQVVTAP